MSTFKEYAILTLLMVGGGILGVIIMAYVLEIASIPVARGVKVAVEDTAGSIVAFIGTRDEWWMESHPEFIPK